MNGMYYFEMNIKQQMLINIDLHYNHICYASTLKVQH